jgi:serine/threonine protein kinase|eukprot:g8673.t1
MSSFGSSRRLSSKSGRPSVNSFSSGGSLRKPTPKAKKKISFVGGATKGRHGPSSAKKSVVKTGSSSKISKKSSFEKRDPPGFTKLSKLGEGGFGTVWDCKNAKSGRSYAIKQLVKGSSADAKRNINTGLNEQWFGRMWFSEGGRIRNQLGICEAMAPEEGRSEGDKWLWKVNPSKYPGVFSIAKLVTTIDTSQDLWLVFEKCGLPLTELLWELKGSFHKGTRIYTCRRRSFWNAMRADKNVLKKFLRKMIEALELTSDSNVVHSDLKPDNILVNYMRGESDFLSLKIIDFGSAYDFELVEKVNSATPEYLPPEALALQCSRPSGRATTVQDNLRDNSVPHAVDMWSLGCIFLEICAGFPLWFGYKSRVDSGSRFLTGLFAVPGRSPEKLISRQIDVVSDLSETLRKCPEIGLSQDDDAIDLLSQMLALEPTERICPQDALSHPFLL